MKTNLDNFQKVIPLRKSLTILRLCSDLKIGTNEYNNSLFKAFIYTKTLFSAMATTIHPVADTQIKKISDILRIFLRIFFGLTVSFQTILLFVFMCDFNNNTN
jgi:hypothetical protein